jgi:two-component sensor histidine kinase
MTTIIRLIYILLLATCMNNLSYAQTVFYKKYSVQEGLLSSDNYRVIHDLDGVVWICSEVGVVKYDGIQFTSFTIKDGLFYNDVWEIQVDSKNRKWLNSFSKGIQYIERDTVKTIKESLSIDQLCFVGEHQDTVFFVNGNLNGLKRYYFAPDGTFGHYDNFSKFGYEVWGDYREEGKILLVPQGRKENAFHVRIYDIETGKIDLFERKITHGQKNNLREIDAFLSPDAKGNNELLIWDKGLLRKLELPDSITKNIIKIVNDPISNYYYIKTVDWMYVFSNLKKMKRDYNIEEIINKTFPFPEKVEYVHVDREDNIWITELRGEIYFIPQMSRWVQNILMETQKSLDENIATMLNYRDDILFSTRSFNLYKYSKITNKICPLIEHDKLFRQWKIRGDKLYIMFMGELVIYPLSYVGSKLIVKPFEATTIKIGQNVLTFDFVNDSTIILGNGKFVSLNGTTVNNKLVFPQRTNAICVTDSIILYSYIYELGIVNLRKNEISKYPIKNTEFIKNINNWIVIGTRGRGVKFLRIVDGKIKKIIEYLTDFDINDVVFFDGQYYFGTNKGVLVGKVNEKYELKITENYLMESLLGLSVNKLFVDTDAILVFTTQGLHKIDRDKFTKRKKNSIRFGCKMTTAGLEFNKNENIQLKSDQNYVTFRFQSVSFFNLGEIVFRYKLIHNKSNIAKEEWQYTNDLKVDFENLLPGSYVFIVESASNKFEPFENQSKFTFKIDFPVYQTFWFRVALVFGVLIIIVITVLISRKVIARKGMWRAKMKNIELRALRAQLNPHFVFNLLNTIQSTIILKGEREANELIVSFADLMRRVLDSSKNDRISLQEEIRFLENYLFLENIRINNTLNYSISLDKNIEPESLLIYSMVFQPIVENVLVHAFITNQEKKELKIYFRLEGNLLIGIVEDNGIGREKSKELGKNKAHKSYASTILNEKADLLNEKRGKQLSIEIIDLYENDQPSGTRVVVEMSVIWQKQLIDQKNIAK